MFSGCCAGSPGRRTTLRYRRPGRPHRARPRRLARRASDAPDPVHRRRPSSRPSAGWPSAYGTQRRLPAKAGGRPPNSRHRAPCRSPVWAHRRSSCCDTASHSIGSALVTPVPPARLPPGLIPPLGTPRPVATPGTRSRPDSIGSPTDPRHPPRPIRQPTAPPPGSATKPSGSVTPPGVHPAGAGRPCPGAPEALGGWTAPSTADRCGRRTRSTGPRVRPHQPHRPHQPDPARSRRGARTTRTTRYQPRTTPRQPRRHPSGWVPRRA